MFVWQLLQDTHCQISGAFSLIHKDLFLLETKFHFWWLYFSYKKFGDIILA